MVNCYVLDFKNRETPAWVVDTRSTYVRVQLPKIDVIFSKTYIKNRTILDNGKIISHELWCSSTGTLCIAVVINSVRVCLSPKENNQL